MGVFKRGNRYYARWRKNGRLIRKTLGPEIKTKAQAAFRKLNEDAWNDRLTWYILNISPQEIGLRSSKINQASIGMIFLSYQRI